MGEPIFVWLESILGLWPAVLLAVAAGVAGLKYGADWLVGGACNLGFRFGMSAVMVGLTLVAFGTSSPELVVSIMTAANEQPEISLGNVIGSNIANTTLILGATALIFPLKIDTSSIRFDGPISFLAILLAWGLALLGGGLERWDGILLLVIFTTWMVWLIRKSLKDKNLQEQHQGIEHEEELIYHERSLGIDIGLMAVGLAGLVIGADLLVAGAVATASALGVSETVVGLTVVAGGTSLPELAVCIVAALKRHGDLTVGNVMGSNIFNALLILGTVVTLAPITFDLSGGIAAGGDAASLFIDFPICVAICGLVVPLMAWGRKLSRLDGAILVAVYFIYIGALLWRELG